MMDCLSYGSPKVDACPRLYFSKLYHIAIKVHICTKNTANKRKHKARNEVWDATQNKPFIKVMYQIFFPLTW